VCSCFGPRLYHFTILYLLQELQADLERQRRVLHNAAVLQARDQEERARISAAPTPPVSEIPPLATTEDLPIGQSDEDMLPLGTPELPPHSSRPIDKPRQPSRPSPDSELPPVGKGRDWQPEAWTPQATRRRGG
jgi:NADH dehydrogenase [ubiquinone] 1 alpha subcomplex assembly factor 2